MKMPFGNPDRLEIVFISEPGTFPEQIKFADLGFRGGVREEEQAERGPVRAILVMGGLRRGSVGPRAG
jgi:hypothetical protein